MAEAFPSTIPALLTAAANRTPDRPALAIIREGELKWRTWGEIHEDVARIATALQVAGISTGHCVAQWAPNSYDWILTDLAIGRLGAIHLPLHNSLSAQQVEEFASRARAKLLVIGGSHAPDGIEDLPVLSHSELAGQAPDSLSLPDSGFDSNQLATLLFTSGTTGEPRGVMLTHENLVSNAVALSDALGSDAEETRLCFLPLSHIYARTCDLYTWLYRGTKLVLAESRETIIRDCKLAKPTVINGVPYFYQKIAQQAADAPAGTLQKLFGGNLKRCFCGGAAIAPEVEQLFERQGVPILSGYGLTETSPVISATAHDDYRPGTVGRPLPNLEVKLSDEGEILVRGPSVMLGYWQDQAATDGALVDDWLHTGDLGEFDEAGHLQIVGRKKEILVLATGKNVSPARVEGLLTGSPLIEHVCVVGEGRNYLGALIVPNPDALKAEIRTRKLWVWSKRRAVTHPRIRELFRDELHRLLALASSEEQIGCFTILPRNFSLEAGELTPKLSLCRTKIAAHYRREIEQMYSH